MTSSWTARCAQAAALTVSSWSLQVITLSSRPPMPPSALIQRAYAWAIAGMPGMSAVRVCCGAQVMTVTGPSPEPPGTPGTTPHPAVRDAHTAIAPAASTPAPAERAGPGRTERTERVRRLPVMEPHDSAASPTAV